MARDRVGIIADVSRVISALEGDIADLRESVLRGYLTTVPENRWLKNSDHQRFFRSETTAHYEDHLADLAAILAEAGP